MSCEERWWDYIGAVNAHVSAIEALSEHARKYEGSYLAEGLLLSRDEILAWLDVAREASATLRIQREKLGAYFEARQHHAALP